MQTAKIQQSGKGAKVVIPAPVNVGGVDVAAGVESFDNIGAAFERLNAINDAYEALASGKIGIELISKDGSPVHGVPTRKATSAEVFKGKDGKAKSEIDLCDIAGYVLVSRDSTGKVRAEWGNPPNFGRYVPMSEDGIAALRSILNPAS